MMIIKTKEADGSYKVLDFSNYLICASSSVKVNNHFTDLNKMHGLNLQAGSKMGSRTFSITGNFEAKNIKDVENFRSEIFNNLFNKNLLLFLDDETFYYNCVLDGTVNTTYNVGWNVGRVFTLSFNLVASTPFLHGAEHTIAGGNVGYNFNINYDGNIPTFPTIIIKEKKPLEIKKSDTPFFTCGKTSIKFIKDFEVPSSISNYIIITKGIFKLKDGTIYSDVLALDSVFNPLLLVNGMNQIVIYRYNLMAEKKWFNNPYNIYFSWQSLYY